MHAYTQDIEPTATPGGEFTDGDPILGIARTVLRSAWPNMLQRELLNVLADPHANDTQDGPLVPDKNNFTQLVQAINNIATAAAQAAAEAAATTRRPIGMIECGPYAVIPPNALALDHTIIGPGGLGAGLYLRADYPALWAWINAYMTPINDLLRASWPGRFTSGDILHAGSFRVPNMPDLFVRAKGPSTADLGQYQVDAMRNITGTLEGGRNVSNGGTFSAVGDAFVGVVQSKNESQSVFTASASGRPWRTVGFDASQGIDGGASHIAGEMRPGNVAWRWIIWAK